MQFSAQQIAQLLQGIIEGNPDVCVRSFAKIEEAQPNDLAFLANPKYLPHLYTTQAGIILVNKDLVLEKPIAATLIRVENAYSALATLLNLYNGQQKPPVGIEQPCYIHETATIEEGVYVGAFSYIGAGAKIGKQTQIFPHSYIGANVTIGQHTTLYAGVKVYHNCQIGNHCILHAGVVVGSDGFGFAPQTDNSFQKIPQIGNVIVKNFVEIGANTCIDRATMGSTIIHNGVKLDNLIQVAHNVEIEENTVIAAQTGIAGSTKLGKNCLIGGQVGFVGHIVVADGTKINAQSGIAKNITKPNEAYGGSPAFAYKENVRANIVFKQLPDIEKRLREIEQHLKNN